MVLLLALLLASPAALGPHRGGLAHLDLGGGFLHSDQPALPDTALDPTTYNGPAGTFAFELGHSLVDDLALHAWVAFGAAPSPRADHSPRSVPCCATAVAFLAGGAGMSWYVTRGLFVTGGAGAGQIAVYERGADGIQRIDGRGWGLALRFGLGHEWPVSARLSMGVALYATYLRHHEKAQQEWNSDNAWSTWVPTLAWSTTFF